MSLSLTIKDHVARLTIDRAAKRNAMNHAMWSALPALVARASVEARVLVVQGAPGGVYCAGADISEVFELSRDSAWRQANQAAIRSAMAALAEAPIPTLALIEGDCIGGGCGLALACDLRIAGREARFGITPARLGLVYSLEDTRRLILAVGSAQAKRILFSGALIDAAEAERIGLATILANDAPGEIELIIAALLATSGHSQREAKAMIARVEKGQIVDDIVTLALFEQAFSGPNFAEGSAAFLEQRKPNFDD